MKNVLLAILMISLFACTNPKATDTAASDTSDEGTTLATLTDEEKAEGWMLLFDGQSADNWRGYLKEGFPEEGWMIKDGELQVSRGGGDLITKEMYENFEFSVDYKIHTEGGNSGIFYLAIESEGEPIYHNAPEYQILDNEYHTTEADSTVYLKHLAGDNYDLHSSVEDFSKPIGEWNTAKVVVNNRKVEHWLNGNKCLEYEIGSDDWNELVAASKFKQWPNYGLATKGHIGLQDHNNTISFKNIKIKKL